MFDSLDEQEVKDISNDVTNDIDIDLNESLFDDLPKPEFVVKDKSIEKRSRKIKPNKNLEKIAKKKTKKRKIPKTKAKSRYNKKS